MVIAGRHGPNQRSHLQEGEDVSFLTVSFGWHCRRKQELKSISALIFSRPTAKLGALDDPPHPPITDVSPPDSEGFMVRSQEKAAAVVQVSMDTNTFKLGFKIHIWDI